MDITDLLPWHLSVNSLNSNEQEWIDKRNAAFEAQQGKNKQGGRLSKSALVKKSITAITDAFKAKAKQSPEVIDVVAKRINKTGLRKTADGITDYVKDNKITSLLIAAEVGGVAWTAAEELIANTEDSGEKGMLTELWESLVPEWAGGSGSADAAFEMLKSGDARALTTTGNHKGGSASTAKLALITRLQRRFGEDTFRDMFVAIKQLTPADFVEYDEQVRISNAVRSGVVL